MDDGPTKKRKQNKTITRTIRGKILEKKDFWKKREKNKSLTLNPLTNFCFSTPTHFDDVAKKILTKYRAPNPISIACFIKDLGAAALNRKKIIKKTL